MWFKWFHLQFRVRSIKPKTEFCTNIPRITQTETFCDVLSSNPNKQSTISQTIIEQRVAKSFPVFVTWRALAISMPLIYRRVLVNFTGDMNVLPEQPAKVRGRAFNSRPVRYRGCSSRFVDRLKFIAARIYSVIQKFNKRSRLRLAYVHRLTSTRSLNGRDMHMCRAQQFTHRREYKIESYEGRFSRLALSSFTTRPVLSRASCINCDLIGRLIERIGTTGLCQIARGTTKSSSNSLLIVCYV